MGAPALHCWADRATLHQLLSLLAPALVEELLVLLTITLVFCPVEEGPLFILKLGFACDLGLSPRCLQGRFSVL